MRFGLVIATMISVMAISMFDTRAFAGEWTKLDQGENWSENCNYSFRGKIERGDLVRIFDDQDWLDGYRHRVCLDSPGGALNEVLAFLKRVDALDRADGFVFATRVRSGQECLSSCAILFMFGQSYGANSPFPDRTMEPGARLGFHSPFVDGKKLSRVDAGQAFQVALEVSKLLVDRSYTSINVQGPALPPELVALVLATPANKMHYVNLIGEMQLLNIGMSKSPEAGVLFAYTQDNIVYLMKRICVSSYALTFRHALMRNGYAFGDLVAYTKRQMQDEQAISLQQLKTFPANDFYPERIVGLLDGPFHHPHWYSAGAVMYCRVELQYERDGQNIRISDYNADFGLLSEIERSVIPDRSDRYREFSAGLLPIDTVYK